MSHITRIRQNPKRRLAALAALLAAGAVAVGSGANFSSSSANPSNTFSSGTLSQSNSKSNAAVLTASGMKPGDPATTGTVDIHNDGSVGGTFTLSKSALTNSDATNPLSGKLDVVISDCGLWASGTAPSCTGASQKYSGKLGAMGTIALGSYGAGDKRRYHFSVSFPDGGSGDDVYQGDSTSLQYDWNASS